MYKISLEGRWVRLILVGLVWRTGGVLEIKFCQKKERESNTKSTLKTRKAAAYLWVSGGY
jgi:hypothetical protein